MRRTSRSQATPAVVIIVSLFSCRLFFWQEAWFILILYWREKSELLIGMCRHCRLKLHFFQRGECLWWGFVYSYQPSLYSSRTRLWGSGSDQTRWKLVFTLNLNTSWSRSHGLLWTGVVLRVCRKAREVWRQQFFIGWKISWQQLIYILKQVNYSILIRAQAPDQTSMLWVGQFVSFQILYLWSTCMCGFLVLSLQLYLVSCILCHDIYLHSQTAELHAIPKPTSEEFLSALRTSIDSHQVSFPRTYKFPTPNSDIYDGKLTPRSLSPPPHVCCFSIGDLLSSGFAGKLVHVFRVGAKDTISWAYEIWTLLTIVKTWQQLVTLVKIRCYW